eukprot:Tbor_TRINITY_DN5695_c3_g1::TRINITY_DN5695_c3_g1_i1::g.8798::m.8798
MEESHTEAIPSHCIHSTIDTMQAIVHDHRNISIGQSAKVQLLKCLSQLQMRLMEDEIELRCRGHGDNNNNNNNSTDGGVSDGDEDHRLWLAMCWSLRKDMTQEHILALSDTSFCVLRDIFTDSCDNRERLSKYRAVMRDSVSYIHA